MKEIPKLELAVKLARQNGMTYAEFQQKETEGKAKIVGDKLLIKGRDYWEGVYEYNQRHTQREL